MLKIDANNKNRSWVDDARARFDAANDALVLPTRSLPAEAARDCFAARSASSF